MVFPQKVIGLIGKETTLKIYSERKIEVEIVGCPQCLQPLTNRIQGQGEVVVRFFTERLSYLQQLIKLKVTDLETGQKQLVEVLSRAFSEKEFFVCLVQSSNIHYGWNPMPTAQYFRTSDDELEIFADENMGNDAFPHALKLAPIFHKFNAPITWLIDDTVASKAAKKIKNWHWKFGDDYALLPRSYFRHNFCNYNTEISTGQTTEIVAVLRDAIQDVFREESYPFYSKVMGVDPWIGSVGTNFVKAAQELGLEGLWGMGYDHLYYETSMFHRGAPWDVYKPRHDNFRVPGGSGNLWLLQWTTRDILNASYFSPNGAMIFSTDADDIRTHHIHQFQDDYFSRLLAEYKKNMAQNDVFVFTVHQQDHESHIATSNKILEKFVDQTHSDNLFVTLDEAVSWLNLKYRPEEHPWQIIEMEDPLKCHSKLQKLANAGEISGILSRHPQWGDFANPKHTAYYGPEALWIARFPNRVPFIFYDYKKSEQSLFSETGEYPLEIIPEIEVIEEQWLSTRLNHEYQLIINCNQPFDALPWIIWNSHLNIPPRRFQVSGLYETQADCFQTGTNLIIILEKLSSGVNSFQFNFPRSNLPLNPAV